MFVHGDRVVEMFCLGCKETEGHDFKKMFCDKCGDLVVLVHSKDTPEGKAAVLESVEELRTKEEALNRLREVYVHYRTEKQKPNPAKVSIDLDLTSQ